jgi:predicted Zn-dependent protease
MMPDNSEANSWFQSHPMLEARIQNAERAGKKRNERLAEKAVD